MPQQSIQPHIPAEFFDRYSLPEAKELLWQWFTAMVTGGFDKLSLAEKEDLVTFYEQLEKLLVTLRAQEALKEQGGKGE